MVVVGTIPTVTTASPFIEPGQVRTFNLRQYAADTETADADLLFYGASASGQGVMTTASIDADGYTLRVSADDMLDDGDQFSVSWTVEDADGNSVEATWSFTADISVTPRLRAPASGDSVLTAIEVMPVLTLTLSGIPDQNLLIGENVIVDLDNYLTNTTGSTPVFTFSGVDAAYSVVELSGNRIRISGISAGSGNFTVTVMAGGLSSSDTLNVAVTIVSAVLQLSGIPNVSLDVGDSVIYDLDDYLTNTTGSSPTFTITGTDDYYSVDELSGNRIRVNGVSEDSGRTFTVNVTAGGLSDFDIVSVTVTGVPAVLNLSGIPNMSLGVGESTIFNPNNYLVNTTGSTPAFTVSGVDSSVYTVSQFNDDRMEITGVAEGSGNFTVTVMAGGLSDSDTLNVAVTVVLDLSGIPNVSIDVGESVTYNMNDYLTNTTGATPVFSFSGADAFYSLTGSLSLVVTGNSVGSGTFFVTVRAGGLSDTETVSVEVTAVPTASLDLSGIPNVSFDVGESVIYDLDDYLTNMTGSSPSFAISGVDAAYSVDELSGNRIRITGDSAGSGSFTVTVTAGGMSDTDIVGVTVGATLDLSGIPNISLDVGESVTYDLDDYLTNTTGSSPSYAFSGVDAFYSLTGSLSLVITGNSVGSGSFNVTVTAGGLSDTETVSVEVGDVIVPPVNPPPVWSGFPTEVSLEQSTSLVYDLSDYASDPDNDPLAYSARFVDGSGAPAVSLTFNGSVLTVYGSLSFEYDEYDLVVSDGETEATTRVLFRVTSPPPVNQAPVWTGSIPSVITLTLGQTVEIDVTFLVSDPDGDEFHLTVTGWPSWGEEFLDGSHFLSLSASNDPGVGEYEDVEYGAVDIHGNASSGGSFTLIINPQ